MARRQNYDDMLGGQDSFLDIVANLVGILAILVMVVTVRARDSFMESQSVEAQPAEDLNVMAVAADVNKVNSDIIDIQKLIKRQEFETQYRSAERNKLMEVIENLELQTTEQEQLLEEDAQRKLARANERRTLEQQLVSLEQSQRVVKNMAPKTKVIEHKPTPRAQTVFGEEIHFRLYNNKIAMIPWDDLIAALKRDAPRFLQELREGDTVQETLGPIDGFRMHYELGTTTAVERSRHGTPHMRSYVGLRRFELHPVDPNMGEETESAVIAGSAFLRQVQGHRPETTTITIWVYPESFEKFRLIQSKLFELGYSCAGRPLPTGIAISGSPQGTRSRAQ